MKKKEKHSAKKENYTYDIISIYEALINDSIALQSNFRVFLNRSIINENNDPLKIHKISLKKKDSEDDTEEISFSNLNKNDLKYVDAIFSGKTCIFDRCDLSFWNSYYAERLSMRGVANIDDLNQLSTIKEEEEYQENNSELPNISSLALNEVNNISSDISLFVQIVNIKDNFFDMLEVKELIYFSMSNKELKLICYKNDIYRIRKKEALTAISAQISKLKKLEKKKRTKQANLKKKDKKDGKISLIVIII